MFNSIYYWVKRDFNEWPLRFCLEIVAWIMSTSVAVIMAFTVPNPPFLIIYPMFITQCFIFGWAAYTRGSSGIVANSFLMATIDIVALCRLISI